MTPETFHLRTAATLTTAPVIEIKTIEELLEKVWHAMNMIALCQSDLDSALAKGVSKSQFADKQARLAHWQWELAMAKSELAAIS